MPNDSNPIGKGGSLPGVSTGLEPKAEGGVGTKWKDIKWTRNKLVATIIGLGLPYLFAIVTTWMVGAPVITYILIGVGMLVGFICLVIGWIDSDEF
ncbi:MAG: hypothetical protein AB4372_30455 [Xenococcus sp. (in: cyanobacteria)]